MQESQTVFVDVNALRVGMFVHLDLGWMSHPFASDSFKITNEQQLEAIRALNLKRLRVDPQKSSVDPQKSSVEPSPAQQGNDATAVQSRPNVAATGTASEQGRRERLAVQKERRARCEAAFAQATACCNEVMACVATQPELARERSQALVGEILRLMMAEGESLIQLLADGAGERVATHSVNVAILSLLLGKAMGLSGPQMQVLGMAAFLHDIGKEQLPERARWRGPTFTAREDKIYQDHVPMGVTKAQRMGLAAPILLGIAQHHEMVDGSGFPLGVKGDRMILPARILALVNRYDNLCNASVPGQALTPHEALALIFAQAKDRFDASSLNAFVRLVGVYPPGSVVQLLDDRYAIVMTVNSARPLLPQVIVHDPQVPKEQALVLNLQQQPQLGIKRSVKPAHLPQAAEYYLSPRKRINYYFDQVLPEADAQASR